MTNENLEVRANPEALLAAIKKKQKVKSGKLHLFLGMAPGVGKTYAMLLAAHEAKKNGKDVVVGVVETHGRVETESLLEGLEVIPKAEFEHRGIKLLEMNIDAILQRRPMIVLVDELAHSNVVGSRHTKRWQDVEELLRSGIDVFSTLNVQHLESRKEAVEAIAKITVQETVPDSVLDRAFQIQLIDLSVPDLLKRLKEGKVYLGEKAEHAAANFFKEEKLTALREIALRLAAEKVDSELKSFVTEREPGTTWPAVERLMVAVGFHSKTEALIRAARKLSYNLECPWIAVHISTNAAVSASEKAALLKSLDLARNLGAEVITLTDLSVTDALIRVAKQNDVTKVIIGRSSRRKLMGQSLFEKLLWESNLDVCIVGDEPQKILKPLNIFKYLALQSTLPSYLKAMGITLGIGLVNVLLSFLIGYQAIGFFFLVGILGLGLFFPLGPVLWSATLSAFLWEFFFIPPIFSLNIAQKSDVFLCLSYLMAAVATGILMRRIRSHQNTLVLREARSRLLHQIINDVAAQAAVKEILAIVLKRVGDFLGGVCDVSLAKRDGQMGNFVLGVMSTPHASRELAVAKWAMEHNQSAGLHTDTLASASALYIPIQSATDKIGALAFQPTPKNPPSTEDFQLLYTIARILGLFIEREHFRKHALSAESAAEAQRLHHTLLRLVTDDVVQELTPLVNKSGGTKPQNISDETLAKWEMLLFRLGNCWTFSRLIAGIFPLDEKWCRPLDLLLFAQEKLPRTWRQKIDIVAHQELPQIKVDVDLVTQAIANILLNAWQHGDQARKVTVEMRHTKNEIRMTIADNGPGVPEEDLGRIFEKFYRGANTCSGGRGLGMPVAKGIIRAHDGKISASNRPEGGLVVEISLPITDGHEGKRI
jgi:two-component system sensor histidine kinase KdpD